jgi:hypothetical protein
MPWSNLVSTPFNWVLMELNWDVKVFASACQFLSSELSLAFHLKPRKIILKFHHEVFLGFS